MNEVQKAAVSVSEMARIVGMSRARFYQLMSEGVFPKPKYDPNTNRPYYDEEAQAECVLVKRRNVGINGQVVIFYASRHPLTGQPKRPWTELASAAAFWTVSSCPSGQVLDLDHLAIHGCEGCDVPFPCRYHGDGLPGEGVDPTGFCWDDFGDEE